MPVELRTKDEISAAYPDVEWRRKFVKLIYLSDFLGHCIISSEYRVSDKLNDAIVLTEYGRRIQTEAVRQDVNAKDARVMCLLKVYHTDLLVDVVRTNVSALQAAIGEQVASLKLRYPFKWGRGLYDAAAELYEVEEDRLTTAETQQLLSDQPQGVFQLGGYTCGPFGLVEVEPSRFLPPTRTIPLYHCSDPSCAAVHRCTLSTSWDAPINDGRTVFNRILEKESVEPSEWSDFASDILTDEKAAFNDLSVAPIWDLIGDGLSDTELGLLFASLLNSTRGELRDYLNSAKPGLKGAAELIAQSLNRAEQMQALLSRPSIEVARELDGLIAEGVIRVPETEIRRPVLNKDRLYGNFGLTAQLGANGFRIISPETHLAPLRLRRMLQELYPISDSSQELELDWKLRSVDGPSVASRMADFVRNGDPVEVVRTLILSDRVHVLTVCQKLEIDESVERTDVQLIRAILWKLGFPGAKSSDLWVGFNRYHHRMVQTAQTAGGSSLIDQESLRSLSANYFVSLEELLDDTLVFVTWALTFDHYGSEKPFTFIPEQHRPWARAQLNDFELASRDDEQKTLAAVYTEKTTLQPLCAGFELLARLLQARFDARESARRTSEGIPQYVGKTTLREFPFEFTMPFANLVPASRNAILQALRLITSTLLSSEVPGVRNDQLHFRRRSSADLGRLGSALAAVREAFDVMSSHGFLRQEYRLSRMVADEWDRATYVLVNSDGRERVFLTPSPADWLRLPGLADNQYLFLSGLFAEPDEMIRFRLEPESEFAKMWQNFPRRRKRRSPITPLPPREEGRVTPLAASDAS